MIREIGACGLCGVVDSVGMANRIVGCAISQLRREVHVEAEIHDSTRNAAIGKKRRAF